MRGTDASARRLFLLGNEIWQDGKQFRPPYARAVGYVFQEGELVCAHVGAPEPASTAIAAPLRTDHSSIIKFDDVVGLLGVESLLERSPRRLSGGERQRGGRPCFVIATQAAAFMDEPLAGLDRFSKDDILPYFEKLHAALAVPVLYVSHDLAEVEQLADYIVLLEQGRVVAAGPLCDIQCDPGSPLARQPEAAVSLDGKIAAHDTAYGLTRLAVKGGTLLVPELDDVVGTVKRIRVRASDVSLARDAPTGSSIINSLPARVLSSGPRRHQVNVLIGSAPGGRHGCCPRHAQIVGTPRDRTRRRSAGPDQGVALTSR